MGQRCCLEVAAVAELLWISLCVFGLADFFVFFFIFDFIIFFERTRSATSMRPPCPIYLPTSAGVSTGCHVYNEARRRERSGRGRLLSLGKKPLHNGVRTGYHYLNSLSVRLSVCLCVCMCNIPRVCSVRYVPRHTAGITGTGHFGKFGTTSIPVADTWVTSVRHQYRFRTLR